MWEVCVCDEASGGLTNGKLQLATKDDWIKSARRMRGAAGPDLWNGREVASLPVELVLAFGSIAENWVAAREVPEIIRCARQVSIPKGNKPCTIENLRPISVFSVWWRLQEGTVAKLTDCVLWRKWIGCKVKVAFTEASETMAGATAQAFDELGFMAALDFSKAYDKMSPRITTRIMRAAKFPVELCELNESVWSRQLRFVRYDGVVSPTPLECRSAHPQGSALGPLMMQLWMVLGYVVVNLTPEEWKDIDECAEGGKNQEKDDGNGPDEQEEEGEGEEERGKKRGRDDGEGEAREGKRRKEEGKGEEE